MTRYISTAMAFSVCGFRSSALMQRDVVQPSPVAAVSDALHHVLGGHRHRHKKSSVTFAATVEATNCVMHDLTYSVNIESREACEKLCAHNEKCAAYVWCYGEGCFGGNNTCFQKDENVIACLKENEGKFPGRVGAIKTSFAEAEEGEEGLLETEEGDAEDDAEELNSDAAAEDAFFNGDISEAVDAVMDAEETNATAEETNATASSEVAEETVSEDNAALRQIYEKILHTNCPGHDDGIAKPNIANSTYIDCQEHCMKEKNCAGFVYCNQGKECVDAHEFMPAFTCHLKNEGCVPWLRQHERESKGFVAGIKPGVKGSHPRDVVVANNIEQADFDTLAHTNCPEHSAGVEGQTRFDKVTVTECEQNCRKTKTCSAFSFCWSDSDCDGIPKQTCLLKDQGCVAWLHGHRGTSLGFVSGIRPGVPGTMEHKLLDDKE